MSLRAFARLWEFSGDWERSGPQTCYFWQPLDVDAPEDARPYVWGNDQVDFYDATGNRMLARNVRRYSLGFPEDLLLAPNGEWFEVKGGRCMYRDGRWFMRWYGWRNSRLAAMANTGFQAYRTAVVPHPLKLWWWNWRRAVQRWRLRAPGRSVRPRTARDRRSDEGGKVDQASARGTDPAGWPCQAPDGCPPD